jgi:hypothetical protein
LTTHPHLEPRLRISRAIPLLPLWAFVACFRVNFSFIDLFIILLYILIIFAKLIRNRMGDVGLNSVTATALNYPARNSARIPLIPQQKFPYIRHKEIAKLVQ